MNELFSEMSRHGVTDQWWLMALAEKANPPSHDPDLCGDVSFFVDGWTVVFFYECCGELDYISEFITPGGFVFDFWELDEDDPWKCDLMTWRGVGDLKRLLKAKKEYGAEK